MCFLRGSCFEYLVSALVVLGCGGGRFISVDQVSATTGGSSAVASGGATSDNTSISDGGASVGGGVTTGGSHSQDGAGGSGGQAATGGSHPTQAGSSSTGGLSASGGAPSSGGSVATSGGSFALGGNSQSNGGEKNTTGGMSLNTGGLRASGGSPPTGGSVSASGGAKSVTGGNGSTGGTFIGSGGNSSRGGNPGTGGLTATGGQSSVTLTFGERPDASCTDITTDTVLNSSEPDLNYGLSPFFGCDASPLSVGLLRFGLNKCVDQIGSLKKVLAARLRLETGACSGCQASVNTTVQLFQLLEDWTEGTGLDTGEIGEANWSERVAGEKWSGAGATGASRGALLSSFKPTALNAEYVIELPAALVQGWLDDATSNSGVLMSTASTAVTPTDAVSFIASDGEKVLSPLLEVDFVAN